ncbi:MAG: hypothetical protein IKN81_06510 [Oscillospiraceae bacterium]|nr:hypothetical protein [Oscillospiraceae bacterium]
MKRNFTRAAVLLLSLVMSMSLLAVPAFAGNEVEGESSGGSQQTKVSVSTKDGLIAAVSDGKNVNKIVELTANITLTDVLRVGQSLTIDLNGHTIQQDTGKNWASTRADTNYGLIQVMPGAELTITGTGTINSQRYVSGDAKGPLSAICAFGTGATVTISGDITATSDNIVLYAYRGGKINASKGTYTNTAAGYVGYNNGSEGNLTIGDLKPTTADNVWFFAPATPKATGNTLKDTSITLDDEIGVNFYMTPTTEGDDKPDYAVLYGPKGAMKITIENAKESAIKAGKDDGSWLFSYPINAMQMQEPVTIKLFKNDGTELGLTQESSSECSVQDYHKAAANKNVTAVTAVTEKMLDFGTYANYYFRSRNKEEGLTKPTQVAQLEDETNKMSGFTAQYAAAQTLPSGFSYKGAALVLDSKTSIRLYFDGLNGLTFRYRISDTKSFVGKDDMFDAKTGSDDNGTYIEIPNIKPTDLASFYKLYIYNEQNDGQSKLIYTRTYSPMSYVKSVLDNESSTQAAKDLVRSLYNYYEAATNYQTGG